LEETLRQQISELNRSRPRSNHDDRLTAEISRLETELTVSKDDLVSSASNPQREREFNIQQSATRNRLVGIRTELGVAQQQIKDLSQKVDQVRLLFKSVYVF